jgi:hypothetical protein
MKSLTMIVGMIWLFSTGFITIFTSISRINDQGKQPILGNCDGQPCFMGIGVKDTTWDTMLTLINDVPSNVIDSNTLIVELPSGLKATVLRARGSSKVDYMTIIFDPSQVDVGTMIAMYGTPCFVVVNSFSKVIVLNYPSLQLTATFAAFEGPVLTPTSKIIQMLMRGDRNNCEHYQPSGNPYMIRTIWYGFATLRHYFPSAH